MLLHIRDFQADGENANKVFPAAEDLTDHTLLKQILQNLIVNGIKFNERMPKRIEIGWQPGYNPFE